MEKTIKSTGSTLCLEKLKDVLPYRLCWLDADNVCQWCTQGFADSLGTTVDAILGNKIDKIIPPSHLRQILNLITKSEATQRSEQALKCSDDETPEQVLMTVAPLLEDDSHTFIYSEENLSVAESEKISLLKKVEKLEKDLEKSDILLHSIINNMPAIIYWKDTNGVYLGDNIHHARLAGINDPAEIVGLTDYDLSWKDAADQLAINDHKVIESGQTLAFDELSELESGQKCYYLSTKNPLYDEDKNPIGIVGVTFDITDRKEMEIQLLKAKDIAEASNRSKSEFIANMSHDIRTPISSLVALSAIMIERSEDEMLKEISTDCYACANQLLNLINTMLDVAIFEHGMYSEKYEILSLEKLLKDIYQLTYVTAKNKGLTLTTHFDAAIPTYIFSQRHTLYRIILNLISNAIKFTESGSVDIRMKLLEMNALSAKISIQISDTGIGVPTDKIQSIFDKFERLSPSDKGTYEGFGLGLYIVNELAEKINAEISVTSEVGKGSVFTVVGTFEVSHKPPVLTDNASL